MCHGLVLEDRQHGRWRWLCAQMPRPAAMVARALLLRAGTLLVLATLASVLALWLDGAAGWFAVLGPWLLALLGFVSSWTVLTALVLALPVSAGGATLALLGLWAVLTLVLPAGLGASAQAGAPMPSRLEAVVRARELLQTAEARNDQLLDDWYRRHPQAHARSPAQHAWPVSFLPRYLWLDEQLRPLMERFERARLEQAVRLSRAAAWSPALALVMTADSLAGHDARRHGEYMAELARREDAWRASLVPAVMSYAGLRSVDLPTLVAVGEPTEPVGTASFGPWPCWWWALVLLAPAGVLARRFGSP
jgi:ABC-2 type transport system permease protein